MLIGFGHDKLALLAKAAVWCYKTLGQSLQPAEITISHLCVYDFRITCLESFGGKRGHDC